MRSVSSQLIGQNLKAETIPLAIKRDSGNEIIPKKHFLKHSIFPLIFLFTLSQDMGSSEDCSG